MSYTKQEFKSGEKLYASQLNAMDEQIYKNATEKIDNPSTGAVGQILEIETVDENGKPKTYKAVNKPTGGGEVVSGGSNEYKWIPRGLMREQIRTFQGWTHCVRYDERLGKAVGVVMGGEASHEGVQPWYRVTIDDNGYMSEYEEIIVYDTDGSTQITPDNGYICGFCILSDGTYLMQDISFNFYKSTDYGKTLKKITSSGHPTQAFGMRQLSTGRIISGCVSGYNRFYYSDDLGATWNESNVLDVTLLGKPPFEADSKYEFSEHCIVEFSNGTLLAIGRSSNNARDTSGTVRGHLEGAVIAYSDDYGVTWRDFGWSKTITNMTSNNASCVCIDGIYHLVMGDRYTYTTDEQGNRRYFAMYYQYATEEDALNDNWSEPVVIDYGHWTEDAAVPTDSGYPSLWKDSVDNLHCVFYDGDGTGHAYGANWRLIDGSPVVESRAVSGEGNGSLIVSYSQAQVDAMLSAQKSSLMNHINELYILVGQLPEVDELDGSMYITDGLMLYFNLVDTTKWDDTGVCCEPVYSKASNIWWHHSNKSALTILDGIPALDPVSNSYAIWDNGNPNNITVTNTNVNLSELGIDSDEGFTLEFGGFSGTSTYQGGKIAAFNWSLSSTGGYTSWTYFNMVPTIVDGAISLVQIYSSYKYTHQDMIHLMYVFTPTEITLYKEGIQVGTVAIDSEQYAVLKTMYIMNGGAEGVRRTINRLYNAPLTADQCMNNYKWFKNFVESYGAE